MATSEYHNSFNNIVYIRKNWSKDGSIQHGINLTDLRFKSGLNSAGSGISTFGGFSLNKQDLLRIVNSMDETDEFIVSEIIQRSNEGTENFKDGVNKITGQLL